jgi:hypothetical protein
MDLYRKVSYIENLMRYMKLDFFLKYLTTLFSISFVTVWVGIKASC